MNRILLFLFLFFSVKPASCQLWSKILGGPDAETIGGTLVASDSSVYCAGQSGSYGSLNVSIYLAKLSNDGNLVWQRTIPTSAGGNILLSQKFDIVQAADNSIFILASSTENVMLFKLDQDGNVLWEKLLDSEGMTKKGGLVATGNDVVLSGGTDTLTIGGMDVRIMKVNSNGTTAWNKTIGTTFNEWGLSIDRVFDGGFIIGGQYNTIQNNTTGYAARTNATGDAIWAGYYTSIGSSNMDLGFYTCAALKGDSTFAFVGRGGTFYTNLCAVRIRLDGSVSNTFISSSLADAGYDVAATEDGGFVAAGGDANYGGSALLVKFTPKGSTEWRRRYIDFGGYSYWNYGFANTVSVTHDGEYILGGANYLTGGAANKPGGLVMKVNSYGNSQHSPEVPVTINGPSSFCDGGSTILSVPDIFLHYQWMWIDENSQVKWRPDSDTSQINVSSWGQYFCIMWDDLSFVVSAGVTVVEAEIPDSVITVVGSLSYCYPQETTLLKVNPALGSTYQWYLNAASISAIGSQYTPVAPGVYTLVITNACGIFTLPPVNINTNSPPVFDIGPDTVHVPVWYGASAPCNKYRFGVDTLNNTQYTWFHNGIPVGNLPVYSTDSPGYYNLVTQNGCGTSYSDTTIIVLDTIHSTLTYDQIYSPTGCNNKLLRFYTEIPGAISYTWKRNGVTVGNSSSYVPGNAFTGLDSGYYSCVITDTCGILSFTHTTDSIWYSESPFLKAVSVSGFSCITSTVLLTASSSAISYQWFRDSILIPGATSQSYLVTQDGDYYCFISAPCGQYTTFIVPCHFSAPLNPIITVEFPYLCSAYGDTLFMDIEGTIPLNSYSLQWRLDGIPIQNATHISYRATLPGNYDLILITQCDTVISNMIALTVLTTNTSIAPLTTSFICPGSTIQIGAQAGYSSYQWIKNGSGIIPGATTNILDVDTAGIYSVTINNLGCVVNTNGSSVNMEVPPGPNFILPETSPLYCGSDSVKLSARTRDDLIYQWYENGSAIAGAIQDHIYAIGSGNFTVELTDSIGCTTLSEILVVDNTVFSSVSIAPGGLPGICLGDTITLSAVNNYLTYQWFFNGDIIPGATTDSYNADTSGIYTLNVSDSQCTGTGNANLNFVSQPVVTAGNVVPSFCGAATGRFTLIFNPTVNIIFSGPTPLAPASSVNAVNYSLLLPGWYTYTAENMYGGCVITDSIEIPISPTINVTINCNNPVACENQNVNMSSSGAFSQYLWSTGQTTSSMQPTVSGIYTLTVTDTITGCTGSDTILFVRNQLPIVNITPPGPLTVCTGSTPPILDAGPGFVQYLWSTGAGTQTISASVAENIIVNVIDSNGCQNRDTVFVALVSPPIATITATGPTSFCPGESVGLNAVSGPYTYLWSTGDTTASIIATAAGIHSVTVTDNSGSCSDTSSINIIHYPEPVISFNPPSPVAACVGDTIQLTVTPGFQSYLWNDGTSTNTLSVTTSGMYTVTVTEANNTCQTVDSIEAVFTVPVAVATASGPTTFCIGSSVTLNVSGTGIVFQWYKGSFPIVGAVTSSLTVYYRGNYLCLVTDANGCSVYSNYIAVNTPCQPPFDPQDKNTDVPGLPFTIVPNPGNGLFYVTIPDQLIPKDILVFDVSGRLVRSFSVSEIYDNQATLDLTELHTGTYYVQLRCEGNKVKRARIVKID